MNKRIHVDFNTMAMDPEERIYLNTAAYDDLPGFLRPGLPVVLYDEDMEVEAKAEFDRADDAWWARPDWSTRRELLDVPSMGAPLLQRP